MKHRLFALFLIAGILLSGLLASCAPKTEEGVPQGMRRAKSASLGLWLFYPEAWSVVENDTVLKITSFEETSLSNPDAFVYGQAQDASVSLANLVAVRLKVPDTVQGLDAYCETVYRTLFDETYVFDGEPSSPTSGTTPRRIYTYHKLNADKKEVRYRFCQCLIEGADGLYCVTYTATDNLYERFLPDAKEAMLSVTFDPIPESENTPVSNPADAAEAVADAPQKEGYAVLTNKGVPYYLYYHEGEFAPVVNSGFIALEAEDHACISVSTFDRGNSGFLSLEEYLDGRYFPEFDAQFGSHTEKTRRTEDLTDRSLCETEFSASIGGKDYRFRLTLLYHATVLDAPISIVTGDLIYLVLYTARDTDFDAHLAETDAIVRELTFK